MLTKDGLKKEFSKDWKKYYQVDLFKEKGFEIRDSHYLIDRSNPK